MTSDVFGCTYDFFILSLRSRVVISSAVYLRQYVAQLGNCLLKVVFR